jgi:acyl-CoA reductase-like NAD-dependent aldehyde dehydrogenase
MAVSADETKIIKDGVPWSTQVEMEFALEALHANKGRWAQLGIPERIQILDELRISFERVMEQWVEYSHVAKGLSEDVPGGGEDWAFASIVFRMLAALKQSLKDIKQHGRPLIPGSLYTRDDGRVVAEVFPRGLKDQLLYAKLNGEVWFNPGVTEQEVLNQQARHYRTPSANGRVALVLGAGNVSMLVPGDFLYKLFVENSVVALKMNPVNEYLGPLLAQGFAPLTSRGFLRILYGGVDEASFLIHHDMVEDLHMTGSDKTYEAIVFGTGEAGKQRKRDRTPLVTKPFTAELGNITPIIVVPGPWTDDDVTYQGQNIAAQLVINAGFNCLTPRVIVQHAEWQHRDTLNNAINATLERTPTRCAYYPGAGERFDQFAAHHPDASQHGARTETNLPWMYIPDVASDADDIAYTTEAFASVMAETALSAASVPDYIDKAVQFVNERLWGTLTASLIVHPQSMRDPQVEAAVRRAIADLRYGAVCINTSGAIAYITLTTSWGGYSGHDKFDIQSGTGVVNNMLMFDDSQIQKSVIWNTFRSPFNGQDPADASSNTFSKKLAQFEADPGVGTTVSLVRALISG